MKKIMVTGVQGQDGSIVSELLFAEGYEVIGVGRRRLDDFSIRDNRLMNLMNSALGIFKYEICDLRESTTVMNLIEKHKPDVIINLAALSSPAESWDNPAGTMFNDTITVINLLESIKLNCPQTFFVQACTAAIYGNSRDPISELSPIDISNPYASAKYASLNLTRQYRDKYNISICNVIMFNHESIWRPDAFVTRKISKTVAKIKVGQAEKLSLWTLTPTRDWGWATEFMEAIISICKLRINDDLNLATGIGATIEDFANAVFDAAELDMHKYLDIDVKGLNTGVDISIGDSNKAKKLIGWHAKTNWQKIAQMMFEHDFRLVQKS